MTNLFRNSTQSSPLQQAIDKAIDPNQTSEDWSLILNICDHVASKEENAKETMKIIRKRLQTIQPSHGWRSVVLTLSLLEALSKNCGKVFHLQLAHRDFLKELKNIIGPKNNPPVLIQAKVLGMIQTWALAFRDDPDLRVIDQFYHECKQQGLEFPPAESETVIKTALPATGTVERPLQATRSNPRRTGSDAYPPPSTNQRMNADQLAKLRSELDVVQTNAQVFGEMLITLQPAEENPHDFELLMELHKTCKQMQARIVDLLGQVTTDDITVDLLRYNDEFNNSFKTFENYMQERDRRFKNSPLYNRSALPVHTPTPTARPVDNEPALIRFDDEPTALTTSFQNMHVASNTASAIPKSTPAPSATTRTVKTVQDPERDVREIEEWLKIQGDESDQEDNSRREDGTTAAFNNFLQKRASTIPTDENSSGYDLYRNIQPVSNRIDPNNTRM